MKTVKRYGANAVEVDGILVSYDTEVARIAEDGSFHRLWSGYSATTMRHVNMFRAALRFRPHGREASTAFDYYRYRGKLDWFQWGN